MRSVTRTWQEGDSDGSGGACGSPRASFPQPHLARDVPLRTKLAAGPTHGGVSGERGWSHEQASCSPAPACGLRTHTHSRTRTQPRTPGPLAEGRRCCPCAGHVPCVAPSSVRLLATAFFLFVSHPSAPHPLVLPATLAACASSLLIHAGPASYFCCCYHYCKH